MYMYTWTQWSIPDTLHVIPIYIYAYIYIYTHTLHMYIHYIIHDGGQDLSLCYGISS